MEITVKSILTEMQTVVKTGTIKSPSWWVDKAIELSALWQELKDELTKYEMAYKLEMSKHLQDGKKKGEAEILVQSSSDKYRIYKHLDGTDKILKEYIMLAKARSKIENYYD